VRKFEPKNNGFKFFLLHLLTKITRKWRLPGVNRFLTFCYSPDRRAKSYIDIVTNYDKGLLIHVNTASYIEWSIFFYGHYEPEVDRLIESIFRPGFVSVDVGANIGCHTLVMARYAGEDGVVIAVEPNPVIHERLHSNIAINRLDNVKLLKCGLSKSSGTLVLHTAPEDFPNQGMSSLYALPQLTIPVRIDLKTLDQIVEEMGLDRLDFVKIDVQGSDLDVLLGGENVIRCMRPHILFEYDQNEWDRSGASLERCKSFFESLGYELYVLHAWHLSRLDFGLPASINVLAVPQSA